MRVGGGAAGTEGVKEAKLKLKAFLQTLETVPREILEAEASQLRREIAEETPYRTGKLEASTYARVIKLGRHRFTLSAGANARAKHNFNYAQIQHEHLGFKHPVKGKAHYVSDPFERASRRIEARFSAEVTPER